MKTLVIVALVTLIVGVLIMPQKSKKIKYVGPYSPEAYKAAEIIQDGGTGTPYTLKIIQAGHDILKAQ